MYSENLFLPEWKKSFLRISRLCEGGEKETGRKLPEIPNWQKTLLGNWTEIPKFRLTNLCCWLDRSLWQFGNRNLEFLDPIPVFFPVTGARILGHMSIFSSVFRIPLQHGLMAFKSPGSWNPEKLWSLKLKPKVSVDWKHSYSVQTLLNPKKIYK